MIPRVLHQTWKDAHVPERFAPLVAGWRERHPGWRHRLWTDAELRDLVARHYAWFLPHYDAYPHDICRVDAARCFLLHRHGGVYVDLDFECLRPVEPLLAGHALLVGAEPDSHLGLPIVTRRPRPPRRLVCNAFVASEAGHPFWETLFAALSARADAFDPLDATGPFLWSDAVEAWPGDPPVHVAPAAALYPFDKMEVEAGALDEPGARARVAATAFAVHHWAGSWIEGFQAEGRRRRAARAAEAPERRSGAGF